jgi:outer membrane protein assembly factor BamB/enterochelin esterase-like enzyme
MRNHPSVRSSILSVALVLALVPSALAASSSSWTQFRGPGAPEATLPEGSYGLEVAWSRDLGAGYSHVWVEGDRAVTMYAAGGVDRLAAFDIDTGEEIWHVELGETYAGHDGSDDGPIGTPTVHDGVVYALGPRGQFVAVNLADGKLRWRRDLDENDSSVPFYGYATSPVIAGDLAVLATGGEGHAMTAFDLATGKPRWSAGDDTVSYQTPMLVELGGRAQLLAVTNHFLQGIDPGDGQVLWQVRHTEDGQPEESAHPTPVDGDRFLVKYGRGAKLYRTSGDGVEMVWETRAFGNTFALPVLIGDHLYGFSGNVLTCVNAATGEIVWRSRDVTSFGLTAIGDTLAILARDGHLVLVDATPEGYRERARVAVFEDGYYAVPSLAGDRFVVRNLARLGAVRVDTTLAPRVAGATEEEALRGAFGAFVGKLRGMDRDARQAAVDDRFAGTVSTPIVEDGGLVHFVWRGAAEDVALTGDVTAGGPEIGLDHVDGTDLFFRSVELDAKGQYAYNFQVDFGPPAADPGNPLTVDNGFAVASELRMPDWPASPHLDPPPADAPRGTLDGFPFRSEILGNTREIRVWRPADYDRDPDTRYPVLVVHHGDNLLRGGSMRNVLDNLVGTTVAPLVAVFVPRLAGPEYGGPRADDHMRFLVEELLPHIDRHYRTVPGDRAVMGPGSAGVASILVALTHPEAFSRVAMQSYYEIQPAHTRIAEMLAADGAKPDLAYVVWSRRDYDLGGGRTARDSTTELLGWLREAGVPVKEQVADYSPGWGGWRGQYDEILPALFPIAEP